MLCQCQVAHIMTCGILYLFFLTHTSVHLRTEQVLHPCASSMSGHLKLTTCHEILTAMFSCIYQSTHYTLDFGSVMSSLHPNTLFISISKLTLVCPKHLPLRMGIPNSFKVMPNLYCAIPTLKFRELQIFNVITVLSSL